MQHAARDPQRTSTQKQRETTHGQLLWSLQRANIWTIGRSTALLIASAQDEQASTAPSVYCPAGSETHCVGQPVGHCPAGSQAQQLGATSRTTAQLVQKTTFGPSVGLAQERNVWTTSLGCGLLVHWRVLGCTSGSTGVYLGAAEQDQCAAL